MRNEWMPQPSKDTFYNGEEQMEILKKWLELVELEIPKHDRRDYITKRMCEEKFLLIKFLYEKQKAA